MKIENREEGELSPFSRLFLTGVRKPVSWAEEVDGMANIHAS